MKLCLNPNSTWSTYAAIRTPEQLHVMTTCVWIKLEDEIIGLTSNYDTTTRGNIDLKLNAYGKKLLSLCKQTGIQIQNGRLSEPKYMCFRPNGASTVDYHLTTLENSKYQTSFNILDRDIYSDHCPLSFRFHANTGSSRRREPNLIPNSYKWNF